MIHHRSIGLISHTALSSIILAAGCASDPAFEDEPVGSRSDAIVNGQLDTTHQAVMLANCRDQPCICTGTLVKKDEATGVGWVVTAGHCMPDPGHAPALRFYVQADKAATYQADYVNTLEKGVIRYPILDWVRHPDYSVTALGGINNDIGIVRVFGVGPETPVIPLTPADDALSGGMSAVDVGYGSSGPFNDTKNFGIAGTRQRADVKIKSVDSKLVVISGEDPGGSINIGDSGGPVLAMVGGIESVVGIHSTRNPGVPFLVAPVQNNTRVSTRLDWVDGELAKAPDVTSCTSCLRIATGGVRACAQTSMKCLDDPDCDAYAKCVEECSNDGTDGPTKACRETCAGPHPNAPALYEQGLACGCGTCAAVCGDTCQGLPSPSEPPPDDGPGTPDDGTNGKPDDGDDLTAGADDEDAPAKSDGCAVASGRTSASSFGFGAAMAALGLAVGRRRRARGARGGPSPRIE